MGGKHPPGYHAIRQAALRAVLARFRAEHPDQYETWLREELERRKAP